MQCPTGKALFTFAEASRKARNASKRYDSRMNAYRCIQCGWSHVGNAMPRAPMQLPLVQKNHHSFGPM